MPPSKPKDAKRARYEQQSEQRVETGDDTGESSGSLLNYELIDEEAPLDNEIDDGYEDSERKSRNLGRS